MPGASRFWTRKDSDLVSQHVALPLDFIKKSLEEKQLHRDQTEAGLLNDDYKMPKNIAWSPEHTAAVDAYNERKKNERLKIQEQFYNSPIDNTNQVASQLLTNRRKTSDEWKEGTGEAWNYQRQYDEYANYAENQRKRLAGKEVTEEDIKLDDYLTRQNFTTKYKGDDYKKAPLNKISVEGVNTSSFADASPIVEKTIAQWKENNHIQEQRDGTFINTDTQEYVPYSDVVKGIQGALAGSNELQSYVRYKGQQSADLLKYQKLDPEQKEQMKNSLRNISNSLLEGASENDYTDDVYQKAIDPKTGKFSREIFDKQRKNDMRYKEGELDKMSDEDLVKEYQKHKLIDLPTIEGGMKASYKKTSRQKTQDNLMVQNAHSDYVTQRKAQGEAIKREYEKRLLGNTRKVGTNINDIAQIKDAEDEGGFLGIMKGLGNALENFGGIFTGKTFTRLSRDLDSGKFKSMGDIVTNMFNPLSTEDANSDVIQEGRKQILNSDQGQLIFDKMRESNIETKPNSGTFFGVDKKDADNKLQEWLKNKPDMKKLSIGEQKYEKYKDDVKKYNEFATKNGISDIIVAGNDNPDYKAKQNELWLGKTETYKSPDGKEVKIFKPGLVENQTIDVTTKKGTFKNVPFNQAMDMMYGDHTPETIQKWKQNSSFNQHVSVMNNPGKDEKGNLTSLAGGNVFTTRMDNGDNITMVASGTEEQKGYFRDNYHLFNSEKQIGEAGDPVNMDRFRDENNIPVTLQGKGNIKLPLSGEVYVKEQKMFVPKNNKKVALFEVPKDAKKEQFDEIIIPRQYTMNKNGEVALDEVLGYGLGYNNSNKPLGIELNNISDQLRTIVDSNNPHLNVSSDPNLSGNDMYKVNSTDKDRQSKSNYNNSSSSVPVKYNVDKGTVESDEEN